MLYNLVTFSHTHTRTLARGLAEGEMAARGVREHGRNYPHLAGSSPRPGGAPSSSVNSHPVLSRPPNSSGTMAPGEHRLKQVHGSPGWNAAGPVTPGAATSRKARRSNRPAGGARRPRSGAGPSPPVRPRPPALPLTTCFRRKVPGCGWVMVPVAHDACW